MSLSLNEASPFRPNGALIFCRVIDNFGDAGVTWRLAGRFTSLGMRATLVIDDMATLRKLVPTLVELPRKDVRDPRVWTSMDVRVIEWADFERALEAEAPLLDPSRMPELVFETFGCRLPEKLERQLAEHSADPRRLILNLEYLSAEDWVEDSHNVWGLHPSLNLKKLWFFPGFTDRTGGVIIEDALRETMDAKLEKSLRVQCLKAIGLQGDAITFYVFTYPENDLKGLAEGFKALAATRKVNVMLAPGKAGEKLLAELGGKTEGLAVKMMPFVTQGEFDKMIKLADVVWVRGEDSFVRAQLNALPLVWSIYPTEDLAHHVKLRAWLARLAPYFARPEEYERWRAFLESWVMGTMTPESFVAWVDELPVWAEAMRRWQHTLLARGDLVDRIISRWQQIQEEAGAAPAVCTRPHVDEDGATYGDTPVHKPVRSVDAAGLGGRGVVRSLRGLRLRTKAA